MLRREYLTLKKRLQCGDLKCFLACCNMIPLLIEAFQTLSDAETDLLIYELCGDCSVASTGSGGAGAGGGQPGSGGTVSQTPGLPDPNAAVQACLQNLQAKICTPGRVAGMNIAKPVLAYLRGLIPSDSPVQPILAAYAYLIDAMLTFCANPTSNGAIIALQTICKYWGLVANVDPTTMSSTLGAAGGTLPSVLSTIFDKDLKDAMNACCTAVASLPATGGQPAGGSTGAGPQMPGLPPWAIPGATGSTPVPTDPGSLIRPIVSSIAQMALGPESPLNNVKQSFLSSMPDGWPPKI